MKTRAEKIDATKDVVLSLLEASGPQTMERIVAEVRLQGYLGCLAFALSGLQFDGSIRFYEVEGVYEVM
jgi:hypothetical protein